MEYRGSNIGASWARGDIKVTESLNIEVTEEELKLIINALKEAELIDILKDKSRSKSGILRRKTERVIKEHKKRT